MDSYSFLDNLLHRFQLWKVFILFTKNVNGIIEDDFNFFLLLCSSQIIFCAYRLGVRFNIFFAETENNDWVKIFFHDDFNDFKQVRSLIHFLFSLFRIHSDNIDWFTHGLHSLVKILFMEFTFIINNHEETLTICWAEIMFKWNRSVISINDITRLFSQFGNPSSKLTGIADSGR